jgi:hypothetical protein
VQSLKGHTTNLRKDHGWQAEFNREDLNNKMIYPVYSVTVPQMAPLCHSVLRLLFKIFESWILGFGSNPSHLIYNYRTEGISIE